MVLSVEDVGRRVVIRQRLEGDPERSVYTDVLGVLESWTVTERGEMLIVRQRDGATVSVPWDSVVAGKPIPASTRGKPPATGPGLARVAALGLPAVTVQPLGDWLLQASDGFTKRANATVACGSSGLDPGSATAIVREFYAEHGLRPLLQVVLDTPIEAELRDQGWTPIDAGPEVLTQVVRLRDLRAALERSAPEPDPALSIELDVELDEQWLALYGRGSPSSNAVRRVLIGPVSDGTGGSGSVTLARVTDTSWSDTSCSDGGSVAAIARGAVTGPWLGLCAITVAEPYRRSGLARSLLLALSEWGAQHGANWAYLQVSADNHAALRLYEELGFRTDHRYRYFEPPDAPPRP